MTKRFGFENLAAETGSSKIFRLENQAEHYFTEIDEVNHMQLKVEHVAENKNQLTYALFSVPEDYSAAAAIEAALAEYEIVPAKKQAGRHLVFEFDYEKKQELPKIKSLKDVLELVAKSSEKNFSSGERGDSGNDFLRAA